MESLQVEIISRKLIKPSSPTPQHLQHYKLSFFDQLAEREHVPLVLFYPQCTSNSTIDENFEEKLEQSLSRMLTHVYPAAGRLSKDGYSIDCLDQGVTFIKANVNCQFDDFINQVQKDLNLALVFFPQGIKDLSDNDFDITPFVVAQVTKFQCGGLVLSISASHPVMDGFTNFKFVYEWAKVCKMGIPAEEINFLSFNFGDIFPARDLSSIFLPRIIVPKDLDARFVGKRFVFDQVIISGLRDKLASAIESGELSFKPSRVEIITAILWRALIRVSEAKHGYLRPSLMFFPVNLRGRISLPLKANAFGNFVIDAPILFVPGETKMELHDLVTLIRNSVQKTVDVCAKGSPDDIVLAVANLYKESFLSPKWGGNDEVDKCMISSLCKFPMQEADFGVGKPKLMHFGLGDYHCCWMYDTECGTGICVQVDLKDTYMHLFECDQDIKAFTKSSISCFKSFL